MLLAPFYINYKKVFEYKKSIKNTVIQRKYTKYSIFIKNADISFS